MPRVLEVGPRGFAPVVASTGDSLRGEIKKRAAIDAAFASPNGMVKIAASLVNPVKKHLDYVSIMRKNVVVEMQPDGQYPAMFDADVEEFTAVKIGAQGSASVLVCASTRTFVDPFEIVVLPKVPWSEVRLRKYKVLDRVKQRLSQSFALEEDALWIAALHSASVITNTEETVAGPISKEALALAMKQLEQHRLAATGVIMNPAAVSGIRRWQYQYIDEVARIELRRTGYLGKLFTAGFFITDLISVDAVNNISYTYVITEPAKLAWMPMWADSEVIPADRPDDLLLGFVGYELLGMIVHNTNGVVRIKFAGND